MKSKNNINVYVYVNVYVNMGNEYYLILSLLKKGFIMEINVIVLP
jgi:hypothetical protein